MARTEYLAMKTDKTNYDLLNSDFKELKSAAKKLANHAVKLGGGLGFASIFLQWLAAISAVYLLILDRTNWKSNMLTSLLVPYIYLTLPKILFSVLRGEIGKWIAFVAIVVQLFFPKHFRDELEMPTSLIVLLVVAPNFIADKIRGHLIGIFICLIIGCYLLQEHIRACGGFRNAFTKANGITNAIGIVLLFVYPVWALVFYFL